MSTPEGASSVPPEAPLSCDVMIDDALLLTLDGQDRVIEGGAVAIANGRIAAVGESADLTTRYRAGRTIDAGGAIVHPGFIDPHAHVNQYSSRSAIPRLQAAGLTMGDWKAQLRPEDEHASVALAALDYLTSGYTAFVEPGTVQAPDAAAEAALETGIRAWLTDPYVGDRPTTLRAFLPELVSDSFLELWPEDLDAALARMGGQLFRNQDSDSRVRGFIGIYGEGTDSPELFSHAHALARAQGVQFHEHLGYLPRLHRAREAEAGRSLIRHLDQLDRLDRHVTLVHMNVVHPDDLPVLTARDVRIVWCPYGQVAMQACDRVESRMADLARAGVSVGLASDIARICGADALGSLAILAGTIAGDAPSPGELLRMRSLGAAACIGAESDIGSLETGKRADIVIRDAAASENLGLDLAYEIGLLGRRHSVRNVLIDGETVVADGQVTGLDAGRIMDDARCSVRGIAQRLGLA